MYPSSYLATRVLASWGIEPPRAPSTQLLDELHAAYLAHVPFENVTKLLRVGGAGSRTDARRRPAEFWSDHLRWKTGGTCFAATSAFRYLLDSLGFSSRGIFCRLPRAEAWAHVALLVDTDAGPRLVDVGYALPAPVLLPARKTIRRRTAHYDVEIRRGPGGEFLVLSEDVRGTRFRYSFRNHGVSDEAFDAAWRRTFRPDAVYMTRLALGRFRPEGRYIYKEPGRVHVISRNRQVEILVAEPRPANLARLFDLPEPLLAGAVAVLEGRGPTCQMDPRHDPAATERAAAAP